MTEINQVSFSATSPSSVVVPKKKQQKPLKTEIKPVEEYENIVLNFGKHNGKSLKELASTDDGKKYLRWIQKRFKDNEDATPTQKAIMRFASAVC